MLLKYNSNNSNDRSTSTYNGKGKAAKGERFEGIVTVADVIRGRLVPTIREHIEINQLKEIIASSSSFLLFGFDD